MTISEDEPREDDQLGAYRLLRKLGRGGMGVVFLAERATDRHRVAVKIPLSRSTSDEGALERFRREVQAASTLQHPNLVRGLHAGESGGRVFYVMEYCDGGTLDDRLKAGPSLPWKEALRIISSVAKGLDYAHDHGFVHRDVKPGNVIFARDGTPKLLDLGLSKNLVDLEEGYRTATGLAVGTPHYMSPEQAEGGKEIDGRADLYSLGVTFYQLLTGKVPYSGSSAFEVIAKHLRGKIPDPRQARPDLPEGVVRVVRKLMAKRREHRYATCKELLEDLDRVDAGALPVGVDPPKESSTNVRAPSSRLPITGLVLLVAAAAAIALIGFWPSAGKPIDGTVDLFRLIDPKVHAIQGSWFLSAQGRLVSRPVLARSTVLIPYDPPEEYDLRLTVRRPDERVDGFDIGLPVGSGGCFLTLDGWGPSPAISGLSVIDGNQAPANPTRREGRVLASGKDHDVLCEVRADRIRMTVDRTEIVLWQGRRDQLQLPSAIWNLPPSHRFFLSVIGACEISRLEIRSLPGSPAAAPPAEVPKKIQSVNLLKEVNPARHAVTGLWKWENGSLVSSRRDHARIQIPYEPPEQYEFEMEFTRREGAGPIVQMCSRQERPFIWVMEEGANRFFGFISGGKRLSEGSGVPQVALRNGQRHTSLVRVERDGCKAFLDGRLVVDWRTSWSGLQTDPSWLLGSDSLLGIGASESVLIIHRAEVREVTGQGLQSDPILQRTHQTDAIGGLGGGPFREERDGMLVGFRFTLSQYLGMPVFRTLQPAYRRKDGSPTYGTMLGWLLPNAVPQEIVARQGYAVAGLQIFGRDRVRGLQMRFMKVVPDGAGLDPSDSYESSWIGAGDPAASRTVTSDGQLVIGVHGRSGAEIDRLGLLLAGGDATLDPSPVEGSAEGALVGHWPLDDSAVEVSGLSPPGKVVGPVRWGEGKIGRAAVFDGKGGYIELPHTEPLDRAGEGSYTLSAWFKPWDVPPGRGSDNDVQYGVLIKGTWQTGLMYDREKKFFSTLYVRSIPQAINIDVMSSTVSEPRRWHHIVGVVHRAGGKNTLYVDGEFRGGARFVPHTPYLDQVQFAWRIGIGWPGAQTYARPAKGSIDDVRIYNRALNAAAVKALYDSAGK